MKLKEELSGLLPCKVKTIYDETFSMTHNDWTSLINVTADLEQGN